GPSRGLARAEPCSARHTGPRTSRVVGVVGARPDLPPARATRESRCSPHPASVENAYLALLAAGGSSKAPAPHTQAPPPVVTSCNRRRLGSRRLWPRDGIIAKRS